MIDSAQILLVEDNAAQARLIQEMSRYGGRPNRFSFVHVQRLQTALARLKEKSFDVVLLDLNLPDAQGMAALDQILQQDDALSVVVLSNSNEPQLQQEVQQHGAQGYLNKRQVSPQRLTQVLCQALGVAAC